MKGYINIIGDIGNSLNGITLKDVVSQVQSQREATEFDVIINSGGGSVYEGFKIYEYLNSLGKPITTIGVEMVASIATIIYASGTTRIMRPNTQFMIHLPSGGIDGTASDIEAYAKELKLAQTKIADFYKENLNLTDEAVYPLLEAETWLDAKEAVSFGFATAIGQEITAKVNLSKPNNNMNLNKEDKSWIESMFNKILGSKKEIVNITMTTADGKIVDFPSVEEGTDVVVGDTATVDGQTAEGEVLMADGKTFVFDKGSLTDIKELVDNEEDGAGATADELKAEIAEKEAEIEALKEQLKEATNKVETMTNEIVNFKKEITSKFSKSKQEPQNKVEVKEENKRKLFKD